MLDKKSVLGIRANNPLCLRFNPSNKWIGQVGSDSGFCKFSEFRYGVRAATFVLLRYVFKYGLFTVQKIIARYAPNSDGNNTELYCNFVVDYINRNCVYSEKSELSGELFEKRFVCMVMAMALVECGFANHDYLVKNEIKKHVKNALLEYANFVLKPRYGTTNFASIYKELQVFNSRLNDDDLKFGEDVSNTPY